MKLPNDEHVMITQEKIVDYLLSDTHSDGRHKAAFFKRFGFTVAEWEIVASALRAHAVEHDVARIETSLYGATVCYRGDHSLSGWERPFHQYHLVYRNGRGDVEVRDHLPC